MEGHRKTDQEAVHLLIESAVNFLDSIKVEPDKNIAESLEVSLSISGQDSTADIAAQNKKRIWEETAELDGIFLRMSAKLMGKGKYSAPLNVLKPFAVSLLKSFDVNAYKNFSDSMELFLKLYSAAHKEEPDAEELFRKNLRSLSSISRDKRTLLRFSVTFASEHGKAYTEIGRKFGALHRSRELAMQLLYYLDVNPEQKFLEAAESFMSLEGVAQDDKPEVKARSRELVRQVRERKEEIDGVLVRLVTGWRPERMTAVDRSILRLMVLEGFMVKSLPAKAAISEAVGLARDFGTSSSPLFVNGVMQRAAEFFGVVEADSDGGD